MRISLFLVLLSACLRFLPQFVAGSGFEIYARILGTDLSALTLGFLAYRLARRQDLRLRSTIGAFCSLMIVAVIANTSLFLFGLEHPASRCLFGLATAFIAFVGIPYVIARRTLKESRSDDNRTIHIVLRRPQSFLFTIASAYLTPCDSCSVMIGESWYRFSKVRNAMRKSNALAMDENRFMVIATPFQADSFDLAQLEELCSKPYRLFTNSCCISIWFLFQRHGVRFNPLHIIPTFFAHRVISYDIKKN